MNRINEVKLDFEPREKILPRLSSSWKPEMYPFESAFLCGPLEEVKPRKVLEIGCAGGGLLRLYCKAWKICNTIIAWIQ